MGLSPKTMEGGRAIVKVDGEVVGYFGNISWSHSITTVPIYTLGNYDPVEITPTAYDPIRVNASGFRLIDNGAHVKAKYPKLSSLLAYQTVDLDIFDRKTGKKIATILNCVPDSASVNHSVQDVSRISVTYIGTKLLDETVTDDVDASAPAYE